MAKNFIKRREGELKAELDRLMFAYRCSQNQKNKSKIMNAADKVAGELKELTGWGKN